MAWWQPEEEPSPQERIGAHPRVGTTSRPVDEQARPEPVARPPRRRRRSPGSGFPYNAPFAVAGLIFVAAFVLPIVFVFTTVDFGGGGSSGVGGVGSREGPSLVPAERFAEAWGKVRAEAGPEDSLQVLRVAPDRIDAIIAAPGGERRGIQVWADLSVVRFSAGSAPGGDRGLSLRRLDTALPERLVRRAAERLGVSRGDVEYLAFAATGASFGGGGTWSIFFGGGRFATADLDGSNLRVPGQ